MFSLMNLGWVTARVITPKKKKELHIVVMIKKRKEGKRRSKKRERKRGTKELEEKGFHYFNNQSGF